MEKSIGLFFYVRLIRLELTRLTALDPKSSVSTNSTTGAFLVKTAQRYNFLAKLETKSTKKFYFGLSPNPSLVRVGNVNENGNLFRKFSNH